MEGDSSKYGNSVGVKRKVRHDDHREDTSQCHHVKTQSVVKRAEESKDVRDLMYFIRVVEWTTGSVTSAALTGDRPI